MATPIEGRVAKILSDNIVILNVGTATGVKPGMAFVVLAQGEEVKDPESGETLGRWEVPKGFLRVTHAQERLSTCEGFLPGKEGAEKKDPRTDVLSAALMADCMRPETWRAVSTSLNVNRSELSGMPAIGPVSVGDVAREMAVAAPAPDAGAEAAKK